MTTPPLLATAIACLVPTLLGAQTLLPGVWRGLFALPGGDPIVVAVTVERPKGKLLMSIRPDGGASSGLGGIREERHRVRFRWALGGGTEFECTLSGREDGRFEGFCEDVHRGADGTILKVPLSIFPTDVPKP